MSDDAPTIYRRKATELRKLAETIIATMRADLIKVAVEWERLAEQAEKEQEQSERPDAE